MKKKKKKLKKKKTVKNFDQNFKNRIRKKKLLKPPKTRLLLFFSTFWGKKKFKFFSKKIFFASWKFKILKNNFWIFFSTCGRVRVRILNQGWTFFFAKITLIKRTWLYLTFSENFEAKYFLKKNLEHFTFWYLFKKKAIFDQK